MIDERIVATVAVLACAVAFRLILGRALRRWLRGAPGYGLLANALAGVLGVAIAFYLLYLWNVIGALLELLTALGIVVTIFLLVIKDIWLSNVFAGFTLIGDRLIDIGSEVEICGKRGKIIEMSLTFTKLRTPDGELVIVPNRRFREEVVVVNGRPQNIAPTSGGQRG